MNNTSPPVLEPQPCDPLTVPLSTPSEGPAAASAASSPDSAPAATDRSILDFYRGDGPDLLAKCRAFHRYVQELEREGTYQSLYRVMLTSGLDHRVRVFDPLRGREVEMICFDSNSYLGVHLHPRVVTAVKRALDHVGFGTPSAQLLCGTNRYLRELEETVAGFHGREDAMIFPSGYAANIGALTALLRKPDRVATDRFSHASIHDGIKASAARQRHVFPHQDLLALDRHLAEASAESSGGGTLIATDGVFSMHGTLAPLAGLRELATRHGATLLVDEAHATGVIGPTGRGLEDHYGLPGAIDVLVGTFSKAPGAAGGYVCGTRELVSYLRFYANAGLFTATLPAATCAGLTEAFRVMEEEPEHRERLWCNVRALAPALLEAGLSLPRQVESPILTVYLGTTRLLRRFSRDLFACGIKCGNVDYPAVPRDEAVVRLAVNARHTREDLERTVEVFTQLGRKYDILHRERGEIHEIGKRIA
jgi:4-hydroxy-2,2'-bipyrrole-5-methanol synthase